MLTSANIPPFTVIDDSGTSAGWNVTLVMTDFQDGTGSDCSTGATHTIDASTTSMNAPYVDIGTDDTDITGVAGHEFIDFTSANKIVVATATHGAGTYLVSPQLLKFVVPTTTFAGTYCSFATIAIASGP